MKRPLLSDLKRVFGELNVWLATLGLMLIAQTAIGQPFIVPSGSMQPTLLVGDEIAAAKYAYGYSRYSAPFGLTPNFTGRILERAPERGDVVVFALPRDPSQTYVKRVIGLPGDRIQMDSGNLFINGERAPRRFVARITVFGETDRRVPGLTFVETLPNARAHTIIKQVAGGALDDTPELVVPEKSYFMLGDNRDNSIDSRVPAAQGGVGFVPADHLIGRVDRVLFSINPIAGWREFLAEPTALRISRVLHPVQ